ncbi:hypothetical protein CMV_026989 [Castanea mollissima]|uniref:Uncharacterized protein n=1 Tax=Castanea mollissima TaxID=60419 RepID=A0A8J4V374_9ROSI|nr:hypothetical protein CMV_026989 [Castanea mollissima]
METNFFGSIPFAIWEFLHHHLQLFNKHGVRELPPEPAADLAHNLLKRIEEFNMHSTEGNAHLKALRTLCKQKASNPEKADTFVMRWVDQLFSKASLILEMYVLEVSVANKDGSFFTPRRKGKKAASLLSQPVTAVYTIGSLVIV